ncbi:Hsp20/alpha crystallin family protein [Thioclava electrotropha]|uniref:Hsp20/alpha crystallin family protein n=1 Tax=Thioclava electrotropha TaxID=1549850 RepID=UPI001E2D4CBE|nr:Hsp20/alpha crystallin family protein [Thioclava electrotropha]
MHGERTSEREAHEGDYVLQERSSGRLERMIALPREVDPDRIEAVLSDGVLTVTLPKAAEAREKDRRIDVKAR